MLKISLKNPAAPVKNPKNIVAGINNKIKRLTGRATTERFPVVYKRRGVTASWADKVPANVSLIFVLTSKIFVLASVFDFLSVGLKILIFSKSGARYMSPRVERKE